jgi:hypothetical protein
VPSEKRESLRGEGLDTKVYPEFRLLQSPITNLISKKGRKGNNLNWIRNEL